MSTTTFFINCLNLAVSLVDFVLFPVNYLIYKRPWTLLKSSDPPTGIHQHHELIFEKDCTDVLYKPALPEPTCKNREAMMMLSIDTMDKVFDYMVNKYGPKECLGHRKVIGTRKHTNEEGKVVNKVLLEDR